MQHGGAANGLKVLGGIGRLAPVRSAVVVAVVLRKEGTYATGAKIRDAELAGAREDDGVGKHHLPRVDAALQIAEDVEATANVVAKVANSLHDLGLAAVVVCPSGFAVKLLVVANKGLNEDLLALATSVCKGLNG